MKPHYTNTNNPCDFPKLEHDANQPLVGSDILPRDVRVALADFIHQLDERYYFCNGSTAAYLHLATALAQHLDGCRE